MLGFVFCRVNNGKKNINRLLSILSFNLSSYLDASVSCFLYHKYLTENELKMPREILRPGNKTAKKHCP